MAFILQDGQGTLFPNDKKGNDKAPDERGELNVGGVMYKLTVWRKQGKSGPWKSLKLEVKEDAPQQPKPAAAVNPNDDIPFN